MISISKGVTDMKNVAQMLRMVFVVAYVLLVLAFIGCAPKQVVIHSNTVYPEQTVSTQNEIIPEMIAPLAAPRMVTDTSVEIVTLVCEYEAN